VIFYVNLDFVLQILTPGQLRKRPAIKYDWRSAKALADEHYGVSGAQLSFERKSQHGDKSHTSAESYAHDHEKNMIQLFAEGSGAKARLEKNNRQGENYQFIDTEFEGIIHLLQRFPQPSKEVSFYVHSDSKIQIHVDSFESGTEYIYSAKTHVGEH